MALHEPEDVCLNGFDAFSSVAGILDRVAKPPNMVAERDKDLYEQLLETMIPSTRKKNLDEEIMFVTALKALAGSVSKISNIYHISLLRNIFSMRIWAYDLDARNALLELITNLALVPDKFLDDCLGMLVREFSPPDWMNEFIHQPRWHAEKKRIYSQLHEALCSISYLVPLAPFKLKDILVRKVLTFHNEKAEIVSFSECMLGLEGSEIGEYLRSTLLSKVVELLVDLDVIITWEDIIREDHNRGIFDMEVEDLEVNAENKSVGGQIVGGEGHGVRGQHKMIDKLDCVMVIVCEHIKSSACDGRLVMVFEALMESFRRTVLNAHKSKFSQFIMFYACSLDPEICGLKFAIFLTDIFISKAEDPISRMSAVSYLASYLSRARFLSSAVVSSIVKRLVEWCYDYCHLQADSQRINNPRGHRLFYAGCQAVMYILCFRMRLLMNIPELKAILFHLPIEAILCHPLDPLRVCLPTIVQEFLRQAEAAHLLKKPLMCGRFENDLLESELSKAFGGVERLDMFFPFDPYLLKESDRFMRPNFEFWSMVRKTYTNFQSDDELVDLDSDSADEEVDDDDEEEEDEDEEEDDIGFSINKMSITPRRGPVFEMGMEDGHIPIPSRMPARIRPSVSPV